MAMTRDDIIQMAREAGFEVDENHDVWITNGYWLRELERFADLVAAMEREECVKLCNWLADRYPETNAVSCSEIISIRGSDGL